LRKRAAVLTHDTELTETAPSYSEFRRFRRVLLRRKIVVFSVFVLGILVIAALFAEVIAPYDPMKTDLREALQGPSWQHWLGTDQQGRDTLSRVIFGSRASLAVAAIALAVASGVGMTLGVLAGYFGGAVHAVLMRIVDALMSFPLIILAIVFASIFGGGISRTMIAVGLSLSPYYARLMCSLVLSVKETDYVKAERLMGASSFSIIRKHVIPNCLPSLIVLVTINVGIAILAEAGLSFLGIGVMPPTPSWGGMVKDGYRYLTSDPVLSIAPGLTIMVVAFAFNMLGDGLRDALDPRLRGTF
jgi:peptide/nickel transport system permease protein